MKNTSEHLISLYEKFSGVVIWGLLSRDDTHRYIHQHFHSTLKKCGIPVVWVDDKEDSQELLRSNSLVIAANMACQFLRIREDLFYCLHNIDMAAYADTKAIRLQVYTNASEQDDVEKWDSVTFFNAKDRILYQPWATDLLPLQFRPPIVWSRFPQKKRVYWVGSVWNNELDQGNIKEMEELGRVLNRVGLSFVHVKGVSNNKNVQLIRRSRIAPTIGGQWQVENNYLPCRMWKNISYGQLGFSNIRKFDEIFIGCNIPGNDIAQKIQNALMIPKSVYRDLTYAQQEIVKKDHTYINRLANIAKAFNQLF